VVAEYGYFLDEGFWFYGSDCDLALRMAALGIRGVQLDLPYWHYGSASWKKAPETEKQMMLIQRMLIGSTSRRSGTLELTIPILSTSR